MIRRPPRSTLFPLHDALPISPDWLKARTWRFRTCPRPVRGTRSEEHTSELQSRLHLVCRLLLEKKKIVNSRGTVVSFTRYTVKYVGRAATAAVLTHASSSRAS